MCVSIKLVCIIKINLSSCLYLGSFICFPQIRSEIFVPFVHNKNYENDSTFLSPNMIFKKYSTSWSVFVIRRDTQLERFIFKQQARPWNLQWTFYWHFKFSYRFFTPSPNSLNIRLNFGFFFLKVPSKFLLCFLLILFLWCFCSKHIL